MTLTVTSDGVAGEHASRADGGHGARGCRTHQSSVPNKRPLGSVGDVVDEACGIGGVANGEATELVESERGRVRVAGRGDASVGGAALGDGAGLDAEGGSAGAPALPMIAGSTPRAGGSPIGARRR